MVRRILVLRDVGARHGVRHQSHDDAGLISGNVLEPDTFGIGAGNLSARLNGAREGRTLTFTKIYDAKVSVRSNVELLPIVYSGRINRRLNAIKGSWLIKGPEPWRGGFRMDRIANTNDPDSA